MQETQLPEVLSWTPHWFNPRGKGRLAVTCIFSILCGVVWGWTEFIALMI